MFERVKQTLVESYVGAIALGYLLAEGILHFANIFASPVAGWVARKEYGKLITDSSAPAGLPLKDALPELVRFVVIVVVWYLLLRWLYFNPPKKGATGQVFN